jgi:membrane-associated phospholipid phosphatase
VSISDGSAGEWILTRSELRDKEMSSRAMPFAIAAAVSVLVFTAAALEPYFAGDVAVARAVQALSPGTTWATFVTSLALTPHKQLVMVLAVGLAWWLAGWKGAALTMAAIAIEQLGAESTKQIAARPRPSRDLITVVGNPSGFSFPSTFTTFITVTFGTVLLLALHSRARAAMAVGTLAALIMVVGWAARVALGAHWPSDVVLTSVVCLSWLWAARRAVLPAS